MASGLACAHAGESQPARGPREIVMSLDDNRATASFSFPNLTYESMLRFELPPGKHQALDVRLLVGTVGSIAISIYENTALESPGELMYTVTRALVPADVSNGQDGRWVVEDLRALNPLEGVVWIGVRKLDGSPAIWTSNTVSGQSYLRDRDASHGVGVLPVKRTPLLRLTLLP